MDGGASSPATATEIIGPPLADGPMFVYNDAMEINAIRTARLVLRPIGPEYLETTLAYAGDPVNTRLMMFMPLMSREEVLQYLENFQKEWAKPRPDACEFAILLDGQHIGEVGVDYYGDPDLAELGWVIHPAHQGRGYVTEAARAVMEFAVQRLGATRFVAHCDAENAASQAVMRKLGMTLADDTGTRKNRGSDELRRELTYTKTAEGFEMENG